MKNYLIYPMETLNLSQSYLEGNHANHANGTPADYPIDMTGIDSGQSAVFCPCNEVELVRIYQPEDKTKENTLYLESVDECITPSGTGKIFMTLSHPNDASVNKVHVGQRFSRGDIITYEGTSGLATGNHIHLTVGFGQCRGMTLNSLGSYVANGDARKPEDMLYLDRSFTTTVLNGKGLNWRDMPSEPVIVLVGTPVERNDLVPQVEIIGDLDGMSVIGGSIRGRVRQGIYSCLEESIVGGVHWIKIEEQLWISENAQVTRLDYYPLGSLRLVDDDSRFAIGYTSHFGMTNCRSGRTYTVRYQVGSQTGVIAENITDEFYWAVPKQFYYEIPNSISDTIQITCETYDQGVSRGETESSMELIVNLSDLLPEVCLQIETDLKTQELTNTSTTLIRGFTDMNYTMEAETKYGATIQQYHLMLDQDTIVPKTGVVSKTEFYDKIYYKAIDSRGLGGWNELEVAVVPYFLPTIISEWTRSDTDPEQILLHYSGTFFHEVFGVESQTENQLALSFRYKKEGETEWSQPVSLNPSIDGNFYSEYDVILPHTFDKEQTYLFEIVASDLLNEVSVISEVKGVTEMNFDLIYPVGRGFIDYTDTDYTNYLGFQWEKTCIGRAPIGLDPTQTEFSTLGKTGGSKALQNHSHTFSGTTSEAGWHQHNTGSQEMCVKLANQSSYTGLRPSGYSSILSVVAVDGAGNHNHTYSGTTATAGQGSSQNLPPYQVVNFWKRVA